MTLQNNIENKYYKIDLTRLFTFMTNNILAFGHRKEHAYSKIKTMTSDVRVCCLRNPLYVAFPGDVNPVRFHITHQPAPVRCLETQFLHTKRMLNNRALMMAKISLIIKYMYIYVVF